jgi:hypothetical protein
MIYSSNLECLPLAGSHKQQSRTNQTWTRTRALDSRSRQRSVSPRYHSTRKRCPAGSHSPNLRSDDIAAPNSTTAYHPPSRADSRIRKKNSAGTETPHRPRRPDRGRNAQGGGCGSTVRWGLRAPGQTQHGDGEEDEMGGGGHRAATPYRPTPLRREHS